LIVADARAGDKGRGALFVDGQPDARVLEHRVDEPLDGLRARVQMALEAA
jgi:hypothetical protein